MAMTIQDIIHAGKRAYVEKDFTTAIERYRSALEHELEAQERAYVLLLLANTYDELSRYSDALLCLKEALSLQESYADAWNNLGIICQKLGKLDEAYAAFERAYRLLPQNAGILVNIGSIALKRGDLGSAKQFLELAIELDPSQTLAFANLSLTFALFGRIEDAEENLRLAVMHGFERYEPIQQRIDKLKDVRSQILNRHATPDGDNQEESQDRTAALELLEALESELYTLCEKYYTAVHERQEPENMPDFTTRIQELRKQVRALRKSLSLEEVLETDTYMGWNYMSEPLS